MPGTDIQQTVQKKYGDIASAVKAGSSRSCCGPSCCSGDAKDPISTGLYSSDQASTLPQRALDASLGCGNPTALIDLREGETVLDLGSGGGVDVFLSARRVGPSGKVYGLDMTDEMLDLARDNQRRAGAENVEFLKGDIQQIPLPDASVDTIISNCVINLAPDKSAVLREAFRVLKPGGRFAVSDIVALGEVPATVRRDVDLWVGCLAGALSDADYTQKLQEAGFQDVSIETWRVYEDAAPASGVDFASAFVRASKPD